MMSGARTALCILSVVLLLLTAGCAEPDTSDYDDAPESVQDGALDYQDYKDAGCPHLDGHLDHETMEECNEWIRNNQSQGETPTISGQG